MPKLKKSLCALSLTLSLTPAVQAQPNQRSELEKFQTQAKNGDTSAMRRMSQIYLYGIGVEPDFLIGREWLERAMQTQDPVAFGEMGSIYEYGLLTPKDLTTAYTYYFQGAQLKDQKSLYSALQLYGQGLGQDPDYLALWQWQLASYSPYELLELYPRIADAFLKYVALRGYRAGVREMLNKGATHFAEALDFDLNNSHLEVLKELCPKLTQEEKEHLFQRLTNNTSTHLIVDYIQHCLNSDEFTSNN